jgi:hypothetical protein
MIFVKNLVAEYIIHTHYILKLFLDWPTLAYINYFNLQKRVIQSMCDTGAGTSCRQLFKDYKILTVTSLYVFEVLCFLKKYKSAIQKK